MGDLKALCEIICGGDLFWIYASWETTVSKLDENRTSGKEPGKIVRKPVKMVSSVARSVHQQAQQISVKIGFIATYASKICKHRKWPSVEENNLRLSRTLGFLPRFWQMAQGGRRSLLQQARSKGFPSGRGSHARSLQYHPTGDIYNAQCGRVPTSYDNCAVAVCSIRETVSKSIRFS